MYVIGTSGYIPINFDENEDTGIGKSGPQRDFFCVIGKGNSLSPFAVY